MIHHQKVIIQTERALLHITTMLLNRSHQVMSMNWKWYTLRINSVQFVEAILKNVD